MVPDQTAAYSLDRDQAAEMLEDQVRRFTNMADRGRRASAREWAVEFSLWLDPDEAHANCESDLAFIEKEFNNES